MPKHHVEITDAQTELCLLLLFAFFFVEFLKELLGDRLDSRLDVGVVADGMPPTGLQRHRPERVGGKLLELFELSFRLFLNFRTFRLCLLLFLSRLQQLDPPTEDEPAPD